MKLEPLRKRIVVIAAMALGFALPRCPSGRLRRRYQVVAETNTGLEATVGATTPMGTATSIGSAPGPRRCRRRPQTQRRSSTTRPCARSCARASAAIRCACGSRTPSGSMPLVIGAAHIALRAPCTVGPYTPYHTTYSLPRAHAPRWKAPPSSQARTGHSSLGAFPPLSSRPAGWC